MDSSSTPRAIYRVRTFASAHKGAIWTVKFNTTGKFVLSGGSDRQIKLWNPHRPPSSSSASTPIEVYSGGHSYDVLDIDISRNSQRFASCGQDKAINLWDVETKVVIRKFRGHLSKVNSVKFGGSDHSINTSGGVDDHCILVSGGYDHTCRLWDLRSKSDQAIQVLSDFTDAVTCAIMHDYDLITTCVDGCIRRYDIRQGSLVMDSFSSGTGPESLTSISLTRDNNCYLVSSLGNPLKLIDVASGNILKYYGSHVNSRYLLNSVVGHDDATVYSGSEDGCVYSWDLVTAQCKQSSPCHSLTPLSDVTISCICHHPLASCLVAASVQGFLSVFSNSGNDVC